jgi:RNA polymerase sigma-70 factor (ECF subfamily)
MPSYGLSSAFTGGREERWRGYMQGIQARDAESLAQLYDETSPMLYGLALRVVNDAADAEEVVLDVYHEIWKAPDRFDADRGTVGVLLNVMTRTRAIDRLRKATARRARELPIESHYDSPSPAPVPETQSIFQQERTLVLRAMESLTPDQRETIELAFFRGLTHSEIAETLGAPLGTIKTRIRGAMQKLRGQLLAPENI